MIPQIKPEVRQEAKKLILAGTKPKQVHNYLRSNVAGDGKLIPSPENLSKMKYAIRLRALPSGKYLSIFILIFLLTYIFDLQEM